jgi:Uma2 family endonuclease
MVSPVVLHRYSFADYLRLEEASNVKHEFLEGEIYAMAGGTPEHAALAISLAVALSNQLRGQPCRVYGSDLRVRVAATGLATYPDLTVVCGPLEHDPESRDTVTNPLMVAEVTSKSTEAYDHGPKLEHYQRIPSLRTVVLVSHRQPELLVLERAAEGQWTSRTFGPGGLVEIQNPTLRLDVDEIYAAAREPGA